MSSGDWTKREIDLIVADYFAMLALDIAELPYVKADHNRALQALIGRSKGSIEFKHQNISAVLLGFGQAWIPGYKPAMNFQGALVDGVRRWLDGNPDWLKPREWWRPSVLADAGESRGPMALRRDMPTLWIGPPPTQRNEPPPVDPKMLERFGQKWDVAARDARNRALGQAGEALVLHHERNSLTQAGREDLADKVRWTAEQDGDGYGFDILSYEPDGQERLLEVKTTNGWERTPFHISANEISVAEVRAKDWHLVRLWNFAREPKAFVLRPPLSARVEFTPTSFLANLS